MRVEDRSVRLEDRSVRLEDRSVRVEERRRRERSRETVRSRGDVSAGHQHVSSVREMGHRRGVGQALGVVRLVVIIGQVVQHVARVVRSGQTLGVWVLPC